MKEEYLLKNIKIVLATIALVIIASPIFPIVSLNSKYASSLYPDGLYVGLTADGNLTSTKILIDEVKSFTNFIIINNPDLLRDKNSIDEVCGYAKNADLNFFVHFKHPAFWKYNYDPFDWIKQAAFGRDHHQ